METGIRVLLLTAVLMTLPGCASVRNWFHHRSEVRQAKAEAKEEAAQQDAQAAAQDADTTPPRVVDPRTTPKPSRLTTWVISSPSRWSLIRICISGQAQK